MSVLDWRYRSRIMKGSKQEVPVCPKCGVIKTPKNTYKHSTSIHRLGPYCKECSKLYERETREKRREHEKQYYKTNQLGTILVYGGKCACCGETEPLFLEIDHTNGGGSKERRENTDIEGFYRWLIRERSGGFQVLCSNCNRGKWRNKGVCPHKREKVN